VTEQTKKPSPFLQLFAAGYGAALIPVTPPGCTISPRSDIRPEDRGKAPGKLNALGQWSSWNWGAHETTEADCARWHASGANIGLRTAAFPLIDGDIDNPGMAAAVLERLTAALGAAPRRWRDNSPRWGLLFRTDQAFRKIKLAWVGAAGVRPRKVEVLGAWRAGGDRRAATPSGARLRWAGAGAGGAPAARHLDTRCRPGRCRALEAWLPIGRRRRRSGWRSPAIPRLGQHSVAERRRPEPKCARPRLRC
jgi:hypothetical protein